MTIWCLRNLLLFPPQQMVICHSNIVIAIKNWKSCTLYTNGIDFKIRLVVGINFPLCNCDRLHWINCCMKFFVMKCLKSVFQLLQFITNAELEEPPLYVLLHPFQGHVYILNFHCISALFWTVKGFQVKSNVPQIMTETNITQLFFMNKIIY